MHRKILSNTLKLLLTISALLIVFFYFFTLTNRSQNFTGQTHKYRLEIRYSHRIYFEPFRESIKIITKNDHSQIKILPIYTIILSVILLYLLWVILQKNFFKNKVVDLKISPFQVILIFLGFFAITYFWWVNYYDLYYPVASQPIYLKLASILTILLTVFLITSSVGLKLYKLFFQDQKNLPLTFLNSTGIGIIVIFLLNFLLASLHQLTQIGIVITLGLLAIFSRKEIITWLKVFFSKNIKIQTPFYGLKIALYFYFLIFAAYNFLLLTRPVPVAHDDLVSYINTVNLLSTEHQHILGSMAYPWQLFLTNFKLLSGNMMTVFWATSISGILCSIAIWFLSSLYIKYRQFSQKCLYLLPLLITVLFYTMPMIRYLATWDTKVDIPGLFFSLIALINFIIYVKHRGQKFLYITSLFLGMAFSIKYVNIYLPISFALFLVVLRLKYKKLFTSKSQPLIIIGVFLITLLPFIILNIYSYKSDFKKMTYTSVLFSKSNQKPLILPKLKDKSKSNLDKIIQINKENNNIEQTRFYGNNKNPLINYVLLPLTLTFNNANATGSMIDISYIPIVIILLMWASPSKKPKTIIYYLFTFTTVTSYFIWLIVGSGIIWYGIAIPTLLLILAIELFCNKQTSEKLPDKIHSYLLKSAVTVWLLFNLISQPYISNGINSNKISKIDVAYAKGMLTGDIYMQFQYPDSIDTVKLINRSNKHANVLIFSQLLIYFIPNNNINTYRIDLTNLAQLTYLADDRTAKTYLQKNNISIIIIDKYELNRTYDIKNYNFFIAQNTRLLQYLSSRHQHLSVFSQPNSRYIICIIKK